MFDWFEMTDETLRGVVILPPLPPLECELAPLEAAPPEASATARSS